MATRPAGGGSGLLPKIQPGITGRPFLPRDAYPAGLGTGETARSADRQTRLLQIGKAALGTRN